MRETVDYGRQPPRFVLVRTAEGFLWRVRRDVSEGDTAELRSLVARETPSDDPDRDPEFLAEYVELLEPVHRTGGGPVYAFGEPGRAPDPEVVEITQELFGLIPRELGGPSGVVDGAELPCFAIVANGSAVSACRTARHVDRVVQAGVNTLEDYRGRGYATRVVRAWGKAVTERGWEPLYSTWRENTASRAVAGKLGLRLVGSDSNIF